MLMREFRYKSAGLSRRHHTSRFGVSGVTCAPSMLSCAPNESIQYQRAWRKREQGQEFDHGSPMLLMNSRSELFLRSTTRMLALLPPVVSEKRSRYSVEGFNKTVEAAPFS